MMASWSEKEIKLYFPRANGHVRFSGKANLPKCRSFHLAQKSMYSFVRAMYPSRNKKRDRTYTSSTSCVFFSSSIAWPVMIATTINRNMQNSAFRWLRRS